MVDSVHEPAPIEGQPSLLLDLRELPSATELDPRVAEVLARDARVDGGDLYERLECSGIGEGQESADARLRSKIAQLARYPKGQSGYAVVTSFRPKPVEICFERWSK